MDTYPLSALINHEQEAEIFLQAPTITQGVGILAPLQPSSPWSVFDENPLSSLPCQRLSYQGEENGYHVFVSPKGQRFFVDTCALKL